MNAPQFIVTLMMKQVLLLCWVKKNKGLSTYSSSIQQHARDTCRSITAKHYYSHFAINHH